MLNRGSHPLYLPDSRDSAWDVDENPELRLGLLYVALVALVVIVAGRLIYVQTVLTEDYATGFEQTTEKYEPIPSRDARILTADGEVLAEDVEIFGIKVHYRWLEEPADPAWLKQQALSRLDRSARKKADRVRTEIERLLSERDALWQRLGRITKTNGQELTRRRAEIQDRVERIARAAEEQRAERATALEGGVARTLEASETLENAPWWKRIWQTVATTLTTPPVREILEPLVVQEQLDYHLVFLDVTREVAAEIEAHPKSFPGTRVELSTRRTYPQGSLAAHIVGYRLPLDDEAIQKRHEQFPTGDPLDYRAGDRRGMTGLELYYERTLRGLRGERKLVLNRRGEVIRTEITRQPRDGMNIELTLNIPLQRAAEHLLAEALHLESEDEATGNPTPLPRGGSIVALDVRTGAILAAASAPTFDLNSHVNHDDAALARLAADTRSPELFRVTRGALPPGSVFKPLSAIALLQSGKLNPEREMFCQGYLDDPDHYRCITFRRFGVGHSDVSLVEALARSCNVYFFEAARRIKPSPIPDWATRFGFGQRTGIDLPYESSGNLPIPGKLADDVMQLAIGQGKLTVTPLQVARMMAAIANGGSLLTPHVVATVRPFVGAPDVLPASTQSDSFATPAPQPIPELARSSLEWVRQGLQQVVAHPQGTGYKNVRLKEVAIAGKTGTAEPGGNRPDHAWFAGYVPAERPRIAFVVILEHAGSGSQAAGPVARKLVQEMLHEGLLGSSLVKPLAN